MANSKNLVTKEIPRSKVLREVYRNFREFEEYVSATGKDVIEHGYWVYNEDGTQHHKVMITISYTDLKGQLNKLSDRKLEATIYNVIMDMKQKDVAEIMKITTVSVGQYVDTAMEQLAVDYFAEERPGESSVQHSGSSRNGRSPDRVDRILRRNVGRG